MTPDELVNRFSSFEQRDLLLLVQKMAMDESRNGLTKSLIETDVGVEILQVLFVDRVAMAKVIAIASEKLFVGMIFGRAVLRPPIWDLAELLCSTPVGQQLATEFACSDAGRQGALKLSATGLRRVFDVLCESKRAESTLIDQLLEADLETTFAKSFVTAEGRHLAALRNPDLVDTVARSVAQHPDTELMSRALRQQLSEFGVSDQPDDDVLDNTSVVLLSLVGALDLAGLVTLIAALDTKGAPELDPAAVQELFDLPKSSRSTVARRLNVSSWHLWQFLQEQDIVEKRASGTKLKPTPRRPKQPDRPTGLTRTVDRGATAEQLDHQNQTPLIDALDTWFDILRKRLQQPIPLKPADNDDLTFLAEALETDLPPDVEAFYRYTNGAWKDDTTPLGNTFLPQAGAFRPIPSKGKKWSPQSITNEWRGIDMTGDAFDDLPGDNYLKQIPVVHFEDGHQLSIITAPTTYQAVALFGGDGMHWAARRLADTINYAIRWEELGLINWHALYIDIDSNYEMTPAYQIPSNPDHFEAVTGQHYTHANAYRGWTWEALG